MKRYLKIIFSLGVILAPAMYVSGLAAEDIIASESSNASSASSELTAKGTSDASNRLAEQGKETCVREGICFPERVLIADKELALRHTAEFRYWGFRVYGAGFYTASQDTDLKSVFGKEPVMLRLHYQRGLTSEDFVESGTKILYKNPANESSVLDSALQQMNKLYSDVKKGDEYSIAFIPNSGTKLFLNNTFQGEVSGDQFGIAFLGIWLNPDFSVGKKFSQALLGIED